MNSTTRRGTMPDQLLGAYPGFGPVGVAAEGKAAAGGSALCGFLQSDQDFTKDISLTLSWLHGSSARAAPGTGVAARDAVRRAELPVPVSAPAPGTGEERSNLVEQTAPAWTGSIEAGTKAIYASSAPADVAAALKKCLMAEGGITAEAQATDDWTIRGTAFVDFVALAFESNVFAANGLAPESAATVIVLRHTSVSDIVTFGRLATQVTEQLASVGARAALESASLSLDQAMWDDFSDFGDEDEEENEGSVPSLAQVMSVIVQASGCQVSSVREEAWQILAQWGHAHSKCAPHLAGALAEHVDFVACELAGGKATLSLMYPLAAFVKCASQCPLTTSAVAVLEPLLSRTENLPGLVVKELQQARYNIREHQGH